MSDPIPISGTVRLYVDGRAVAQGGTISRVSDLYRFTFTVADEIAPGARLRVVAEGLTHTVYFDGRPAEVERRGREVSWTG